ncbi:MAG: PSD1 domain-containing protein [Verrucomicrobiales bacterium]|nr:PSD1 domain-containing protein [Verrucomicrobiales bacterium]
MRLLLFFLLVVTTGFVPVASSTADDKAGLAFFESKIRPVLIKHCFECHAKDSKKIGGKLRLDNREDFRKGGESGPPMVAGKPGESLIIHALKWKEDLEMPPKAPLPEAVIADFEKWIAMGAPDPRVPEKPIPVANPVPTATTLWSFQPIQSPPLPPTKNRQWGVTPVDQFVLARMEQAGLTPTADASPGELIRRLSVDLLGLPPTFEQSSSFQKDFSEQGQQALERVVDHMLASPQFGEQWGRHWLDVARFGESNGNDGLSRNPTFPHAWRYRDYVIDAFNEDMPYDQFLTEQIAGDLLPASNDIQRDRQLVATGFLALGSKPAKAMNENFEMDVIDDQINVVSAGVMGLSVACARCHDHKHDPIPTRDYYALAGIFKSTESLWGVAANEALTAPATDLHVLQSAAHVSPPEGFKETVLVLDSNTGKPKPPPKPKWPVDTPLAMGVRDRKESVDCRINLKGDSKSLGDQVPRGFLTACVMPGEPVIQEKSRSGRLELAVWLTRRDHPLTARVMVNRVWHHLFGQGIVTTPDDFGVYGSRPSHPDLLDYLATRFQNQGWSVKRLIRDIVLSRTYQLSSSAADALVTADPDNLWMSRHLRRRLDAETIRDAMLQASNDLTLVPGAGSIIRHRDILLNLAGDLHEASPHRSVYLCRLRNSPPPELSAFDLPDGVAVAGKRDVTTLPTQALFLVNSPFVLDQSRRLARLLISQPAIEDPVRAEIILRRVLGRPPAPGEVDRALAMIQDVDAELKLQGTTPNLRIEMAWSAYVQALFATNEFRYVD